MGVVSGLAGVARFFEMMVDVDEWPVYGLDRDVLDRSIAILFVHNCVWDSELWLQLKGDLVTQLAASSGFTVPIKSTLVSLKISHFEFVSQPFCHF